MTHAALLVQARIPLVRNSDPITSHAAADRSKFFRVGHKALIYHALCEMGSATAHELERVTRLTVVQIDRRLPEIGAAGFARKTTQQRDGFTVWEVV